LNIYHVIAKWDLDTPALNFKRFSRGAIALMASPWEGHLCRHQHSLSFIGLNPTVVSPAATSLLLWPANDPAAADLRMAALKKPTDPSSDRPAGRVAHAPYENGGFARTTDVSTWRSGIVQFALSRATF
jgi:hypothetical protein